MKRLAPLVFLALGACGLFQQDGGDPSAGPSSGGSVTAPAGTAAADSEAKLKPASIDSTRRFELADVWVTLGDPDSQRALVPYLLKPEEWMLVKCENLTPTFKHYVFQRIITQDGRALPSVDPFRKPPPAPLTHPGKT